MTTARDGSPVHGPFTSIILDDAELEDQLGEHRLRLNRWLDNRRSWLAAVPVGH